MEIRRDVLGTNPAFQMKPIPDVCVRAKTITKNPLGIISIFRDRRPEAVQWIESVVPTMWIGRKEEILAVFWHSTDDSWFEFDTGKKTLSICWIAKK